MLAKCSLINCLASLSLAVAALTSCGSGTGDSIAFDDLESEALAATCRLSVACGTFPDEATCHASISSTNGFYPTMRVDIASGRVIYDGAQARQCLDLIGSVSTCTHSRLNTLLAGTNSACARTFTGTGAPDTPCFFDEECANQGICEVTTACGAVACCQGTCRARPTPIPIGGACGSAALAYQSCAEGSICTYDSAGTTATCRAQTAGVGASCSPASACMASLYCAVPAEDPNAAAVCAQPSGRGGACTGLNYRSCDDVHDRCGDDNTCQPLIPVGGACSGTSLGCVSYARCDGTTCVALGKVGEPCEPGSFGQCLGTLDCDSTGRCAKPAAGGACR